MAAAAKTRGEAPGKRREIVGICLLGLGVFCALSLISMQAGSNKMMGPGGAAAAAGLYSLAGFGAYVLVAGMILVAVRCFKGNLMPRGLMESFGALGILAGAAVLLHLPFAGKPTLLRGPGGLLGQWLGEIVASFIGGVGAALAATMTITICLLLITKVRVADVLASLAWAGHHVGCGLAAAGRGIGRMVVAMFPEKESSYGKTEADDEDDAESLNVDEEDIVARVEARSTQTPYGDSSPPIIVEASSGDSEAVRVGRAVVFGDDAQTRAITTITDEAPKVGAGPPPPPVRSDDDERRAMAALVAEVAAVECAAVAQAETPAASDVPADLPPISRPSPVDATMTVAGDKNEIGPIIVEPAFRTRLRDEALADEPAKDQGPGFIRLSEGDFVLPATEMLTYNPPPSTETDKQALYDMAERLEQAMANYGVRGKVKEIHMGPVVTMFEFAPAPGTRTGKIAQLENDLAMALEAQAVRIVAPIPGKAVVGVEVPNKTRETVYLREILEDDCFTGAASKLQVGLGKDIKGAPVSVNLGKMPHLLVAGTTGSGKSVAVNSMITSMLYSATPEEVRFIMVDPKMLELSIYEGIPHLLLPVVTDPKKANLALRWAVDEMERRYELLAKTGVRDIASYNAKLGGVSGKESAAAPEAALAETPSGRARRLKVMITGDDGIEREVEIGDDAAHAVPSAELLEEESAKAAAAQAAVDGAEPVPRKLPYIVIVIDEFADLMMVAPKDVETSVARLAQKARAAGLHLILATQRPSVDVITGLIKANFPSRIALQVASKIDSRTILDQPGAETLLGNGDMLFSDRGTKLRRIHGAFLADDEVHRVVDFLKTQAKPVYDMNILKPRDEENEDGAAIADDYHDDLYDQGIAIVCDTRQATVSYLQRRLQIGYNRAARMIEQMEREGIVGPANGIKAREVLAPQGEYLQAAP